MECPSSQEAVHRSRVRAGGSSSEQPAPLTDGHHASLYIFWGKADRGLVRAQHMGLCPAEGAAVNGPHISPGSNFPQRFQFPSHKALSVKNSSEWKIGFHFLCCPLLGVTKLGFRRRRSPGNSFLSVTMQGRAGITDPTTKHLLAGGVSPLATSRKQQQKRGGGSLQHRRSGVCFALTRCVRLYQKTYFHASYPALTSPLM